MTMNFSSARADSSSTQHMCSYLQKSHLQDVFMNFSTWRLNVSSFVHKIHLLSIFIQLIFRLSFPFQECKDALDFSLGNDSRYQFQRTRATPTISLGRVNTVMETLHQSISLNVWGVCMYVDFPVELALNSQLK